MAEFSPKIALHNRAFIYKFKGRLSPRMSTGESKEVDRTKSTKHFVCSYLSILAAKCLTVLIDCNFPDHINATDAQIQRLVTDCGILQLPQFYIRILHFSLWLTAVTCNSQATTRQNILIQCFCKVFWEIETVSLIFPTVSQSTEETRFTTTIKTH